MLGLNRLLSKGPVEFRDRSRKALMIEAVLSDFLQRPIAEKQILDIGCGNGGISRHFAKRNRVTGVDIRDRRKGNAEPFEFVLTDSEKLPLPDDSFDLVLSHHVIEHVADQGAHLDEIHRVLKPDGVCYLATPNKSSPLMRGHVGNTMVLSYAQMVPLFQKHGFFSKEYGTQVFTEPDRYAQGLRVGRLVPRALARLLRPFYPSQIFVLVRREGSVDGLRGPTGP